MINFLGSAQIIACGSPALNFKVIGEEQLPVILVAILCNSVKSIKLL